MIDTIHSDFVYEFQVDETETIPQLKKQRTSLRRQLASVTSTEDIEKHHELSDKITDITKRIQALKAKKHAYIMDNTRHLFDYFENKQSIATTLVTDTAQNKQINDFFKIPTTPELAEDVTKPKPQNFVRRYLNNVNKHVLSLDSFITDINACPYCKTVGEVMLVESEGIFICMACASNIPCLIENEKASYKEPPKEVSFYAYRKINHFKEIITQFQGKETTHIPDEVIDTIQRQIARERIQPNELTYYKMKEMLKYLQFSKYYEHIAFIKSILGIRPPNFSTEFEETLCNLFLEIQGPYAEVCPDSRVNFLGYYYVLYKLCEKCGQTQYLRDIPMLKDQDKIACQDETWKKICAHPTLQWTFKHTNREYIARTSTDRTVFDMMQSRS